MLGQKLIIIKLPCLIDLIKEAHKCAFQKLVSFDWHQKDRTFGWLD